MKKLVTLSLAALFATASPAARAGDDGFGGESLEDLLELDLGLRSEVYHVHTAGEWMVGYRYMSMHMDGMRDGSSGVSPAEVFAEGYMITPTEMDMEMHMFRLMYAPSDDWTYMAMVPFQRTSMKHQMMSGVRFTTESQGLTDVGLSGLYTAWRHDFEDRSDRLILKIGLSVPTGSINATDRTPMGKITLPYPMQLGSGTFDFRPGLTYLGQTPDWAWGADLSTALRKWENRKDYRLGSRAEVSAWADRRLASWLSFSLRLEGQVWGRVHGADDRLNAGMVPTANGHRLSGRRLDLLGALNLVGMAGMSTDHRLSIEIGAPILQSLNGPQLETDMRLSVGWNVTFK